MANYFNVLKNQNEQKEKNLVKENSSDQCQKILMGEKNKIVVKIPQNVTHAIQNVGNNMLYLLINIDEPFNQQDPDTFPGKPNPCNY